jgi:UDP-glucose 4-epimerase
MTKIIITGGAGFIGSHIAHAAHDLNYHITIIDDLSTGNLDNLGALQDAPNVQFVNADINNKAHILPAFEDVDSVLHLAARISVPESMEHPDWYFKTNTLGTLNVLECCREQHVKNIVHSSSAALYGDNPILPKVETLTPEPKSPYAISKLDGEYLLNMYQTQFNMHCVSLRYFNVFGPRQNPHSAYAAAVPIFIEKALNGHDITIYGDGEQTRDFIYVGDIAKANLLASERGRGVINAACARSISINDLAATIIDITGSSSKIHHLSERAGDIKHSCADNTKLKNELGLTPQDNWIKGLEATIAHFEQAKV